jgi:hypothetical protein
VEPLDLIDEIYEAAVIPDLWLRTLDRLAKIAGGEGAFLFSADHKSTQFLSSPAIEPLFRARLSESWIDHNERDKRLRPILEPRFLTDFDAFSPEELETIPFYKNFLRVAGFGWCAGTAIRSPTTETMVFSIERLFEKGPVEPEAVATLDALRPHLARAAAMSTASSAIARARAGSRRHCGGGSEFVGRSYRGQLAAGAVRAGDYNPRSRPPAVRESLNANIFRKFIGAGGPRRRGAFVSPSRQWRQCARGRASHAIARGGTRSIHRRAPAALCHGAVSSFPSSGRAASGLVRSDPGGSACRAPDWRRTHGERSGSSFGRPGQHGSRAIEIDIRENRCAAAG